MSSILFCRAKQIKKPKKSYNEDDPEGFKGMPVPDKVRDGERCPIYITASICVFKVNSSDQ